MHVAVSPPGDVNDVFTLINLYVKFPLIKRVRELHNLVFYWLCFILCFPKKLHYVVLSLSKYWLPEIKYVLVLRNKIRDAQIWTLLTELLKSMFSQ